MKQSRKDQVFALVRKLMGRGFKPHEVEALDGVLDGETRMTPDAPSRPELGASPKSTGREGIALMHRFEGCARKRRDGKFQAYPDPGTRGEPYTIGWGHTGTDPFNGGRIKPQTVWTRAQCDEAFKMRLAEEFEPGVRKALGSALAGTSAAQFDAMVSFAYNVGVRAFARSTLLKMHKAGNHAGAAKQFMRWNKAGGRVLKGLTRRRAAEAKLYRSGS